MDDRAVDKVMGKLFKNYKTWCKFLGRKHSLRLDAMVSATIVIGSCFNYFYFCFMLYVLDLMLDLHAGFPKVSKKYSKGRYCIWVYISSSGVKQRMSALCQNVCAIFFIM